MNYQIKLIILLIISVGVANAQQMGRVGDLYVNGKKVKGHPSRTAHSDSLMQKILNDTSYVHNQKVKGLAPQIVPVCDTVYDFLEVSPVYSKGDGALFVYIIKELSPIVGNCIKMNETVIDKLHIVLTIDRNGNVIDATFPNTIATITCQKEMKEKLIKMSGWTAGKMNGQWVCSKFKIPIGCLKWE